MKSVSGIILAGGRGRRVGGLDKGLLKFKGDELIKHQVRWLSPQVDELLISANRNLEHYKSFGYPVVSDSDQNFNGPLAGILEGLKNCTNDWLFTTPVDVPCLPDDLLTKFFNEFGCRAQVGYLKTNTRDHYLNMLVNKSSIGLLEKACDHGRLRVRDFLSSADAVPIDLGLDEVYFSNLNNLEQYDFPTK